MRVRIVFGVEMLKCCQTAKGEKRNFFLSVIQDVARKSCLE